MLEDLKNIIHGIEQFMKKNNSEISNNEIKKQLLSMSVVKKNTKVDTEKILFDYLYPKFGERVKNAATSKN